MSVIRFMDHSNRKRRRQTILVVDDEPGIRTLVRRLLEEEEYEVMEAANADEAAELFEAARRGIDLLLTDVRMPGLSGPELANRLAALRDGLRVLYMSGYVGEELLRSGDGAGELLGKPFTPDELLSRVRAILATPARGAA